MCELLGISVDPPASMGLLFKAFRPRAAENVSGWGIGWYASDGLQIVKDTQRADQSDAADALADDPPSSGTFVIHVRAATVGSVSRVNTHPFTATLGNKQWLFAHNGTIRNLDRLDTGHFQPKGQTDSEVAFHYLLTRITKIGDEATDDDVAHEILTGARELSADGKANFLMTDGATMYAYHDGHKTLHYVERQAQGAMRVADDADYTIDLRAGAAAAGRAVVIASVPLTDENWTKCEPGEFLICRQGKLEPRIR